MDVRLSVTPPVGAAGTAGPVRINTHQDNGCNPTNGIAPESVAMWRWEGAFAVDTPRMYRSVAPTDSCAFRVRFTTSFMSSTDIKLLLDGESGPVKTQFGFQQVEPNDLARILCEHKIAVKNMRKHQKLI